MMNDIVTEELNKLLNKLRTEEQEALWHFSEAQQQLHQIREHLAAVESTMKLLDRQSDVSTLRYDAVMNALKEARKEGKTQLEAIEIIAANSNNHLKASDAQQLMTESGFISTPKNAASIIYTLISRSGKFKKIKPGEYHLLSDQELDDTRKPISN